MTRCASSECAVSISERVSDGRTLQFGFEAIEIAARVLLDFVDEGGGCSFCRFGEEGTRAIERFRDHVGHLRLRIGDEVAARLIEFASEFVCNGASLLAELLRGVLAGFFGGGLRLSLRALLVPFGGFVQIFDGLLP